jgi:vacuolar-type H+-ATPase subunit H
LDGSEKRQKALAEAEQKRKKTVETAISAAQAQGLAEAEVLKKQTQKQHQQLHEKAAGKMPMAATKVINHLKG